MLRFLRISVIGLALLVSGCGLPPAIVAFTYAIDGFSYVSSGKGMSDHVLSAAIDQDCAIFRAVQGKEICHDNAQTHGETMIASGSDDGLSGSLGIAAGPTEKITVVTAGTETATLIGPNDAPVRLDSTEGHPETARLMNFPAASEVYALVQDDGALEIFVYRSAPADSENTLSHIATYDNYADNPTALIGVTIGGSFHAIGDLIV